MGSRYTKYDLERVTDYLEFESFCHTLMSRVGYDNSEPLGGFADRGRDAIRVSRSSGETTIFAYSVREDWKRKLDEDLQKIRRHGHSCDGVVFVTTATPTATEIDKLKEAVKRDYGWQLDVYGLERIATLIDGAHGDLISKHPGIFVLSSLDREPSPLNRKKAEARPAPLMVPDLPADFVARPREYDQLIRALLRSNTGRAVGITAALNGAGGYGKTTLATAVCHDKRIRARFRDGILWVALGETPGDLTGRVEDLIQALTGERPGFSHITAATARLKEVLDERRPLLVIDDVWRPEHLRPFMQGGSRSTWLISTRNRDVLPPECETIDVDAMKREEAVSLLGTGLDAGAVKQLDPHLRDLAAQLGEWPLLLKLVNGILRTRTRSQPLAAAMKFVTKALQQAGINAFNKDRSEGREHSVRRTLDVSLDCLADSERERFEELAILPEDFDIPLVTISKLWKRRARLDDMDSELLCEKLERLSLLLKFDRGPAKIRLHDVIRKYLIRRNGGDLQLIHEALLDAHRPGSDRWADLPFEEPYIWDHLTYHMIGAGRIRELVDTAKDLRYLAAAVYARGALGAEQDLTQATNSDQEDAALKALRQTFIRCGHLFNRLNNLNDIAATLSSRIGHIEILRPMVELLDLGIARPYIAPSHCLPDLPHPALVRTLAGHSGKVTDCAISGDGKSAVSAAEDKTVKLWDLETGRELFTLTGHSAPVASCAISGDGRRAVSASWDGTVKVWDLDSGRALFTLTGHSGWVNGCAINGDGARAVSASGDGTVKVWDLETGRELFSLTAHLGGINGCAISGDGKLAVSATAQETLKVLDLRTGRELLTLIGHSNQVLSCAIRGDGKWAVSASWDKTAKVWDLETGRELFTLTGHSGPVTGCAISGDGKLAASGSFDETVKVWDLETGRELLTLTGHSGPVSGCAISRDGKRAVSASWDATVKVWDLETTSELIMLTGHSNRVYGCAISGNGKRAVAASGDKTVKVWDLGSARELFTLTGHSGRVNCCAISSDESRAVSGSEDQTVKVWDLKTRLELFSLTGYSGGVNGCAISGDGNRVVSAAGETVKAWDLKTGCELFTLTGHSGAVNGCAIRGDGARAVSASGDATIKLWDLETGRELVTLAGHSGSVNACAIGWDGKRGISASSDKTIKAWDLESGRELFTLKGHSAPVNGCALSGDGKRAVSVSLDQTIRAWDLERGECLGTLVVDGLLNACAMSPDGIRVVAAGDRGVYFLELRVDVCQTTSNMTYS